MSDRDVDFERVRREHLAEVDRRAHWAYLLGILIVGTVLMLTLIAWLGSAAG